MEQFEFNNITQIVNRFKTDLKQRNIKQIYFAKDTLQISASLFYGFKKNVLKKYFWEFDLKGPYKFFYFFFISFN